jgi:hypothetical protein
VDVANEHNINEPKTADSGRFGIRVSAPAQDPFIRLVGGDWHTFHWFATREERDRAMQDMAMRHRYSRTEDAPSIVLEPVER